MQENVRQFLKQPIAVFLSLIMLFFMAVFFYGVYLSIKELKFYEFVGNDLLAIVVCVLILILLYKKSVLKESSKHQYNTIATRKNYHNYFIFIIGNLCFIFSGLILILKNYVNPEWSLFLRLASVFIFLLGAALVILSMILAWILNSTGNKK